MTLIVTMLSYDFMRSAFAAGLVVSLVAACVGYFLVLRNLTFAGHALSHVGFAGATGAVLLGLSPLGGLLLATLLGGVGMGLLGERLRGRDVAVGVILTLSLGLGTLFLHFYTQFATQANALLFGNVLGVSPATLHSLMWLALICLAGLALIASPLLFASLEPELAEARGVSLRLISVLFLMIVAAAVAESVQVVGILLVFALMVGPAAAAGRLTGKLWWGLGLSALLAMLETALGITLAYLTDWPTSFWISALSAGVYLLSLGVGRWAATRRPESRGLPAPRLGK